MIPVSGHGLKIMEWRTESTSDYHNNRNCQAGNSIAPENLQQGTGGKPLCEECERLNSSGGPIGNLTNL